MIRIEIQLWAGCKSALGWNIPYPKQGHFSHCLPAENLCIDFSAGKIA
jgi:hypothetical protein